MPFLDMKLELKEGKIATSWYQKPTDAGLVLQFRALTPMVYKNIIERTLYKIFESTSTWQNIVEGVDSAMKVWEANQYPQFYQPLIKAKLD